MKHKLQSRLLGEISVTSDMQMIPPSLQKKKGTKGLHEGERGRWESWLKTQHRKTKIMASGPITPWQKKIGKQWKQWQTLFSWAPKSLQMVTAAMKLKVAWSLERKTMTNLDSILKSSDMSLLTKVHLVKAMVFPVVMYVCESWTIKKTECWIIDAFELWYWRRLMRVHWTARSIQWMLKEILNIHWKD